MNELKTKLEEIRELISEHKESCYNKNEQAVCDDIIKPILNTLGWKSNPNFIVAKDCSDEGKFPDYTLKKNKKAILILEAKKMSINVTDDKIINQIGQYCYFQCTNFGIMTNGATWLLYETFQRDKTQRIVWKINILTDSIEKSVSLLGTLNYENIESLELMTKKNKTLDQLWTNLKSDNAIFIKPISDLLKNQIKLSITDLSYQDEEIENFTRSKIEELFVKDNNSNKTLSNISRTTITATNFFDINVPPSWPSHKCICFPTKKKDLMPSAGKKFILHYDNKKTEKIITEKSPTFILGLSDFWEHKTVTPESKIRISIIKIFEEYSLELV